MREIVLNNPCPSPSPERSHSSSSLVQGAPWWKEASQSETELSQDSDGFPTFKFVESMGAFDPEKKHGGDGDEEMSKEMFRFGDDDGDDDGDEPDEAEELAHEFTKPTKKPACKQVVMKKPGAQVIATVIKKPSTKAVGDIICQASVCLKGPFSRKSYIAHKKPHKLVAAVTSTQSGNHHEVLQQVIDRIKKTPGCTKCMAVAWRDEILSE